MSASRRDLEHCGINPHDRRRCAGHVAARRDVVPRRVGRSAGRTRSRGCWTPLPKRQQPDAKKPLHAPTRKDAAQALERLPEAYDAECPTAVAKREPRLAAPHGVLRPPRRALASTCAPATRSSRASPRSSSAPASRRATDRRSSRWRWRSCCWMPRRNAGGSSTVTSSSPTCSRTRRTRPGSGPRGEPSAVREDRRPRFFFNARHPQHLTLLRQG